MAWGVMLVLEKSTDGFEELWGVVQSHRSVLTVAGWLLLSVAMVVEDIAGWKCFGVALAGKERCRPNERK